jgi:4-amino-4-deoxy-L-arabinose transferase-like glycosyltransferase
MKSYLSEQTQAEASRASGATSVSPSRSWYLILIFLLWAAIYVPGLFHPALLDDADSVHAEAAREMVLRHDWVTLHANGVRYLEKAPLMYWAMAASFKIFGVSEWSARLPLALGTLGLLFAAYALGKYACGQSASARVLDVSNLDGGKRSGLYAAIILGTGFGPYIFTRILLPDVLVALWLTLGFLFFLRTLEEEKASRRNCWGLAATVALNVLTKGLIGLVFPAVIILVVLLLTGNVRHLLKLRIVSSTVVFLAIAAPWHILAGLRNPGVYNPAHGWVHGFFWFYFVNEHFLRYLGLREPKDYDTVPLVAFWALAIAWILPWSAFLPQAVGQLRWPGSETEAAKKAAETRAGRWRNLRAQVRGNRRNCAMLLFAAWGFMVLFFFSFSTRQEYYSIPAVPALALLIAGWMQQEESAPDDSRARRWGRLSSAVLLGAGVAVSVAALYLLRFSVRAPNQGLAELLKKNPEKYALSLGHVFDLTPDALSVFRVPLLGFAVAMLAGTALNWWWRRRGRAGAGNAALTLMMIAVLFCVHLGFIEFSPILTSKRLALAVKDVYRPGDVIIINAEYEPGATMNFYTGEPVHIMRNFGNLWYGSFFPDAPPVYENEQSFARLWNSSTRVFLWSDEARPELLQGKTWYEFAHDGGKYIYTNKPD